MVDFQFVFALVVVSNFSNFHRWAGAGVGVGTPMTVFKKLAVFNEILKFLNVFGLIEILVNFLMAY